LNGTGHAAIGAAVGFIAANTFQATTSDTLLFIGLGTVSAMLPDLDIDGKLRGRITLSSQIIKTAAQFIGALIILYSLYEGFGTDRYMGIAVGVSMIILTLFIKQRHMLMITGIGVLVAGSSLQQLWLTLFGIYIIIASFVSHRSYTHSILGILFFGWIALELEKSLGIHGVFYTCLFAYISHLAADSRFLPFNKRGVKLFLPLSSKEF